MFAWMFEVYLEEKKGAYTDSLHESTSVINFFIAYCVYHL